MSVDVKVDTIVFNSVSLMLLLKNRIIMVKYLLVGDVKMDTHINHHHQCLISIRTILILGATSSLANWIVLFNTG
jgi:hypothetical protein